MVIENIERDFHKKVCSELTLTSEGINRFRVFTPFQFDDGDHLAIVLKRENGNWILSDEGHTYMHLTYSMEAEDLQKGTRQKIISKALSSFNVDDCEGELRIVIEDEKYGDALYSFVQALLKITDVTYLSRERVKSTFLEDFRAFLTDTLPEERRQFDWFHPKHDPQGNYIVDCRVNKMSKPLFIYGLLNDDRTRDATIDLLQFEKWDLQNHSLAIFEDQENINRKVLARFSDVCDKQFSSLNDKDRIEKYIKEFVGL